MDSTKRAKYRVLSGICADTACNAKLFFPAHEASVECTQCGQRHDVRSLRDTSPVTDPEVRISYHSSRISSVNMKICSVIFVICVFHEMCYVFNTW